MPSVKEKRKKITELVYKVMDKLDKTKENSDRYRKFFDSLSDAEFSKWAEAFFKNPDENFFLEVLPYKNEPKLKDILDALKILNIPSREYVTCHHLGGITTKQPVPVGYVLCKRHQQILSKKNSLVDDIHIRNAKTGQVTGDSKAARESDMEVYSLKAYGADNVLKEILGPRADNMKAKSQMYEKINEEGFVSLEELSNNPEDKVTLNTINVMYLAAGIKTNLIRDDILLPATLEKRKQKK
jgi:hypothetical protein